MEKAAQRGVSMHFPVDFVVGDEFKEDTPHTTVEAKEGIPEAKMVRISI